MKLLCPPLLSLFPLLSPSVAAFRTQLYSGRHLTNLNMSRHDDLIEKERAKAGFRYVEEIGPGLRLDMELKRLLHTSLSEFQEVQVVETYFGMTLVTDGKTQSAAHDEFVYHESLVHPPLFINAMLNNGSGGPKSVFIGGGGELATAREVLKHNTIERLVMVDLDGDVIEVCKKYLPEWGGETVANHPKMELIIGDAHKYLTETSEKFDVICMDISDPIEAGPGIALYTQEFYKHASTLLNDNGVFVTQAGSADFIPHVHAVPSGSADESGDSNKESWCFAAITNTLATVFDSAVPYTCQVPSFGEDWGFVLAFNQKSSGAAWHPRHMGAEEVDLMIKDRIENIPGIPAHHSTGQTREYTGSERGEDALLHYDGEIHRALFSLSKPLRKGMKRDKRIMTVDNPVFMY